MTWTRWRRVRQAVQWIVLAFYVYLLFAALQTRVAFPLADLFFRLDPLAASSATISARSWIPRLLPAIGILLLTLGLGRVWCGWLCPLGTLLDLARFRGASRLGYESGSLGGLRARLAAHDGAWRRVKYILLFLLAGGALVGSLSLLFLDPLTILTRTMTTAVLPTLNRLVTGAESAAYSLRAFRGMVNALESALRGHVLPVKQSAFYGNLLFSALFVSLLALNLLADRFWCRYLCPLGAFLGLLSRLSVVRRRISPTCNNCASCALACSLGAIHPAQGYESDPAECTVCLDCLAACPQSGIIFRAHARPAPAQPYDPTRRQFLASLGGMALGAALLEGEIGTLTPHPRLVRPPGVQDERAFLRRCVRCSQCMKVCPTSGLQPCLEEAGLRGLWTPRLVPRLGYCDYSCNACGQICPTGAIPPLDLAVKRQMVIGKACIDTDRCLPWAGATPCIVCEEMCPVPEKAIRVIEATAVNAAGEEVFVQRPYMVRELCIGCGICEYQCPMEGQAAIRVQRG